jgi:glycosyltransferase involved in cell wall biosynthesis
MANPTVSVVMPAFNASAFISDAITSVLNQSFEDIELLVVDNLSTDSTMKIAQQFKDPRVRVTQCNKRGAAAARNAGANLARGGYLQFLDADDLLFPEKIENQLKLLRTCPPRTVASCAWGRFYEDANNAEFFREPVWKDYTKAWEWLLESWEGGGMMQTACWLVPREIVEEVGPWNESLISNPNDDGEYFCRVLLRSLSVAYCPINGVFYRSCIPGSVSRQADDNAVESAFCTCELYEKHIENAGLSTRFHAALRRNYLNFIYQYHPTHMDLMKKAWRRAVLMGGRSAEGIGGELFQQVTRKIGFMSALRLREVLGPLRSNKLPLGRR